MSDKCSNFLTSSVYPDVRNMQQTPDEVAVGIAAFIDSLGPPAVAFPCVFGQMRRRHSSHVSASPGGYFATGAERLAPLILTVFKPRIVRSTRST